ncbi:MAG: hypothetical protein U5P41_09165 [Gammaproteobacteria bacterium]|nr:hypothetical protein [Gammaproteobacteria bacterium]
MVCTSTSRADQATEPVRETLWTSPALMAAYACHGLRKRLI